MASNAWMDMRDKWVTSTSKQDDEVTRILNKDIRSMQAEIYKNGNKTIEANNMLLKDINKKKSDLKIQKSLIEPPHLNTKAGVRPRRNFQKMDVISGIQCGYMGCLEDPYISDFSVNEHGNTACFDFIELSLGYIID
jgi:hypothetical protein